MAISSAILGWVGVLASCTAHGATDAFVADLQSPLPQVRRQAAVTLGRLGDPAAVPGLVESLADPAEEVRREAAKALGAIKDGRAVPGLIQALRDDDKTVRFYAAYALGEIKDPRSAGPLLEALDDPEWCVRNQAAWALRELRDPALAKPLAAAFEKENADLPHLVWLMRHLGGERAADHLAALLRNANPRVRLRAVRTLGELQEAAAFGPLVAALEDVRPEVRRLAVAGLLELGDDRALKPLRQLLAREEEPSVREAIEEAVFQLSRHPSLVAHWSFDDRSTSVAKDVTGRGNDGQVLGCTPVEGKAGFALEFDGQGYVELGKPAHLMIGGRPLTITAWVKSAVRDGIVVARGGAFCGFSLYLKDGAARFGIHRVQDGPAYIAAGQEEVVGRWVHLAGVIKEDRIELYVDGKLAATEKTAGYIPGECGQGMEIGYDVGNSPAEIIDHFQGIIDEVKVFEAALSAEEIAKECRLADD